jgi:hypothetical protein
LYRALQMWYAWAVVWDGSSGAADAAEHEQTVLTLASTALPECVMLTFALADVLEAHKQAQEALQVHEVRGQLMFTTLCLAQSLVRQGEAICHWPYGLGTV